MSFYDDYLSDLRKEHKKLPYLRTADITTRRLAPKFAETRGRVEDMMRKEDASPLAKARFALSEEGQIIDQMGNIYSEAQVRDIARQDEISGKIKELEFQKKQYDKTEEERKDKAKAGAWTTAAGIIGTIGGTIATSGNVAAGLKIGQAASGLVGAGFGIEQEDPDMILQGAGDLLAGTSGAIKVASQQKFIDDLSEKLPDFSKMSSGQYDEFLLRYSLAKTSDARRNLFDWLESIKNNFGTSESFALPPMSDLG